MLTFSVRSSAGKRARSVSLSCVTARILSATRSHLRAEPLADVYASPNLLLHDHHPVPRLPVCPRIFCRQLLMRRLGSRIFFSGRDLLRGRGRFAKSRFERLRFPSHPRSPWTPSTMIGRFPWRASMHVI